MGPSSSTVVDTSACISLIVHSQAPLYTSYLLGSDLSYSSHLKQESIIQLFFKQISRIWTRYLTINIQRDIFHNESSFFHISTYAFCASLIILGINRFFPQASSLHTALLSSLHLLNQLRKPASLRSSLQCPFPCHRC